MLVLASALAATIPVATVAELRAAVAAAVPGDVLLLLDGTYLLEDTLLVTADGTSSRPITMRADNPGAVTIESDTTEAIKVSGAWWRFQDLVIRGICANDSDCEHAFHIVGDADGTTVSGCTLVDFNAQIKGNGEDEGAGYVWPDDVVIEGCELYDTAPRQTANPVTKVDVVGGQRWRMTGNYLHDFEKGLGDHVSYAAFYKGHSKRGTMERNLVVCVRDFTGGTRVGLSLGGGGTSPDSICEDGTCTPEHEFGVLRNNLIVHCNDVGIYLNKATDTRILHDTLFDTAGIDVRFAESTAEVRNTILDGRIRERDGGTVTLGTNLADIGTDVMRGWFADADGLDFTLVSDPGIVGAAEPLDDVVNDFCAAIRDATPDLGAVEYTVPAPCDTSMPHSSEVDTPPDTGSTPTDTGGSTETAPTGTDSATSTEDTGPADNPDEEKRTTDPGCGCGVGGGQGVTIPGLVLLALTRRTPRAPDRPVGDPRG